MKKRPAQFDYDAIVIGGGSAGYAAARTLHGGGKKVAVIEGAKEVGGLCILRGCMPTKALLYAAEVRHLAQHGKTWGLKVPSAGFDLAQVMARKDAMIADFAGYRRQQLESGKYDFIRTQARFEDAHTLALADGEKVTARHFVLATGSVLAPPPLPELAEIGCLTSDSALTLKKLPRSLLMLGGGAIALEYAQFFARLDVQVTIIQRSSQLLRDFDADAAAEVEKALAHENIKIYCDTQLVSAFQKGRKKGVEFIHRKKTVRLEADEIFHALGRTPNTAGLGLEAAGVATEKGRIVADLGQQTSQPHIFAAGDCTGPHEIVHIAIQQAEIAAHNILRPRTPRRMDYRLLTSVVFTDPQAANVGLTEKMAQAQKIPYLTAQYPFNDHGKSMIMDTKFGFVKLLAAPKTGEILGGCCVGPAGGELIHEIIVAMQARMTVQALAATPHYHPTLAEIWTYPAEELAEQI